MVKNILKLSQDLISIKSNPDCREDLNRALVTALEPVKDFTIEHFENDGVKSSLVYKGSRRPTKFKILLNGHLDVIPAKDSQYNPRVENERLYGAGALDMKSNLACMILLFAEVANTVSYPLGLQIVTDEETGGFKGTKYQIEQGVRADFIISGETTNFDIVHRAKGIIWCKISITGKTAHGAYPWKGENAILRMQNFLSLLTKAFPNPKKEKWANTINVANIKSTNSAFNKIPDQCEVWLDIRYIPEDSTTIMTSLKKILPADFALEIIANEPALSVDKNNSHIQKLAKITQAATGKKTLLRGANGSSDARHFTAVGCDGIEFGPIGEGIGSDDEWISIPSLEQYTEILREFLLTS